MGLLFGWHKRSPKHLLIIVKTEIAALKIVCLGLRQGGPAASAAWSATSKGLLLFRYIFH